MNPELGSPLWKVLERMKEAAEEAITAIRDEDDIQILMDQLEDLASIDLGEDLRDCITSVLCEQAHSLNYDRFSTYEFL